MSVRPAMLVIACLVGAIACEDDATAIVVEVRSDLMAPAELDAVRIEARRLGEADTTATAELSVSPLPRTLALIHEGGPLGPVELTVSGTLAGSSVVERELSIFFESDTELRLIVDLSRSCVAVSCPEGQACANGACRPIAVEPCEFQGRSCTPIDAGAIDADRPDARQSDAGACPILAGICGVGDVHAIGDRVAPRACAGGMASISWTLEGSAGPVTPESGSTPDAPIYRLVGPPADFTISASVAGVAGCEASRTVSTTAPVLTASGVTAPRRPSDLAARTGMAFVASDDGPYAITEAGWRDLAVGANGDVVTETQVAVVALDGEAFFGSDSNRRAISRVSVTSDFSAIDFVDLPLPGGGDQTVRTMGAPVQSTPPLIVVGTRNEVSVLEGSTFSPRALAPSWEAQRGVAVGRTEAPGRGAVWAVRADLIRNWATGAGTSFNDSAETALVASDVRAIAVDDRPGLEARLWLCSRDLGIEVFDLSADWSTLTSLPAAIATVTTSCDDLAVDASGDVWAATSTGLVRLDSNGNQVAIAGVPAGSASLVAATWDGSGRDIWLITGDSDVFRLTVGNPD